MKFKAIVPDRRHLLVYLATFRKWTTTKRIDAWAFVLAF